uniref:Calcineurin-like phosphoesterase domain-containing protein n=1 Tax=Chromera velia CCMP2878 TaxID=1169474 RepID=A0A0G4HTZ6_9ALVE|eukprot:Cvel_8542.t1-p1 / transcript=Cvel_8542.t1 / gene=Cvel_8542 / organism=Chromera_velia_CCMP2878 / gene_product=hypothetical protein / transcript_product=hypothetical protein / location=Cvel_scaffold473:75474-78501(-) / protein_length=659 / sequence_SO=supercontig / SO=protein_coding / is_pseudo=false
MRSFYFLSLLCFALLGGRSQGYELFAIGDTHGDEHFFYNAMLATEKFRVDKSGALQWRDDLIDTDFEVVLTGDYLDRGEKGLAIIKHLKRLSEERPENLVPMLGNHEEMLLRGDAWRAGGAKPELDDWGATDRAGSILGEGDYAEWNDYLKTRPVAYVARNGVFLCHGGISAQNAEKVREKFDSDDVKPKDESITEYAVKAINKAAQEHYDEFQHCMRENVWAAYRLQFGPAPLPDRFDAAEVESEKLDTEQKKKEEKNPPEVTTPPQEETPSPAPPPSPPLPGPPEISPPAPSEETPSPSPSEEVKKPTPEVSPPPPEEEVSPPPAEETKRTDGDLPPPPAREDAPRKAPRPMAPPPPAPKKHTGEKDELEAGGWQARMKSKGNRRGRGRKKNPEPEPEEDEDEESGGLLLGHITSFMMRSARVAKSAPQNLLIKLALSQNFRLYSQAFRVCTAVYPAPWMIAAAHDADDGNANGVTWFRGFSRLPAFMMQSGKEAQGEKLEQMMTNIEVRKRDVCDDATRSMKLLGVTGLVMGHTNWDHVMRLCSGVYSIDVSPQECQRAPAPGDECGFDLEAAAMRMPSRKLIEAPRKSAQILKWTKNGKVVRCLTRKPVEGRGGQIYPSGETGLGIPVDVQIECGDPLDATKLTTDKIGPAKKPQ